MNFYGSEQGKAIINICPTKYIFKQTSSSVDEITEFFHLADGTKEFLTIANPGECVLSLNNNVTAVKYEVANFEKDIVFT